MIRSGIPEGVLEGRQQLGSQRAVDDAVIAGQGDGHHTGEGDAAVLLLDRLAPDRADGEDGGVRRVDDGGEFANAIHAEIGNRGGAALILVRQQFAVSRPGGKVAHLG